MPNTDLIDSLSGGLVVSCQPVTGGPLDTIDAIVRFALAAEAGGAAALRIEGARNVEAVTGASRLPVIAIVKRDLADSPVRITPFIEDVDALAAAGAAVIAVDATHRDRPVSIADLIARIHAHGCLAMADLSNIEEAEAARNVGFDIIGTTLSGYTGGTVPSEPDLALVSACARLGRPVIAEGRYNTPELVASARKAGATAVCVGSAITRTEHVVEWFRDAARHAGPEDGKPVLAMDIGGTKTLVALVRNGVILDRRQSPTAGAIGSADWFATIRDLVAPWAGRYDRVGAAVTGVVRNGLWSALNPDTLAIPPDLPIEAELATLLGVPVLAVNDAQAAAWAEHRYGAGRGSDTVFVTISSGIGGGVVRDGRLVAGARGLAGSLGQVRQRDGAPRLESLASGFAISRLAAGRGRPADTYKVFDAAAAGESWAIDILKVSASALTDALVNLQFLLDPEIVVIGGGIGLQPLYFALLEELCATRPENARPTLRRARLAGDAGIIGVADLAREAGVARRTYDVGSASAIWPGRVVTGLK